MRPLVSLFSKWNRLLQSHRTITTSSAFSNQTQCERRPPKLLDQVLYDADKLVNCSKPNLAQLLDEEILIVSHMLQKLIGASHSLSEVDKLYQNGTNPEDFIRGIVVLLTSKMAQHLGSSPAEPISSSQWTIAKTSEMIHMAVVIHNRIRNVKQDLLNTNDDDSKVNLRNKISILYGDFLWARAWKELSNLTDLTVIEMIVTVLLNTSLGLFMSEVELTGEAKVEEKVNFDYWLEKNFMLSACLPAFGCKSTIKLALPNLERTQNYGYELGKNFGYITKVYQELLWFTSPTVDTSEPLDFCSLPLIMHAAETGDNLLQLRANTTTEGPSYDHRQLHAIVRNGPGMVKAKTILDNFRANASRNLSHFPATDAKEHLEKIISAMNVSL